MNCRAFALLLGTCVLAAGADWLTRGGDLQRTGWQTEEKLLSARTVKRLKLLWKRKFNGELTDPSLLGPIVTHRGIKELVFVQDRSDMVYAVDADLGTVYWSRKLRSASPSCAESRLLMPAIAPAVKRPEDSAAEDDDHYSDGNKPLYVLSADRRLYALRPSTGDDFSPPLTFLSPGAEPTSLDVAQNGLYVTTASTCGGVPDRLWSFDLEPSGLPPSSRPQGRPWHGNPQALTVFSWKGERLLMTLNSGNKPVFSSTKDDLLLSNRSGGVAVWQNAAGTRWVYTASRSGITAFQVMDSNGQPTPVPSWTSRDSVAGGSPVVANGIIYFLSAAGKGEAGSLTLHALDASDGKNLYTGSDLISAHLSSGNLAIANGHVCFSADGILYCFGLPFEI